MFWNLLLCTPEAWNDLSIWTNYEIQLSITAAWMTLGAPLYCKACKHSVIEFWSRFISAYRARPWDIRVSKLITTCCSHIAVHGMQVEWVITGSWTIRWNKFSWKCGNFNWIFRLQKAFVKRKFLQNVTKSPDDGNCLFIYQRKWKQHWKGSKLLTFIANKIADYQLQNVTRRFARSRL